MIRAKWILGGEIIDLVGAHSESQTSHSQSQRRVLAGAVTASAECTASINQRSEPRSAQPSVRGHQPTNQPTIFLLIIILPGLSGRWLPVTSCELLSCQFPLSPRHQVQSECCRYLELQCCSPLLLLTSPLTRQSSA